MQDRTSVVVEIGANADVAVAAAAVRAWAGARGLEASLAAEVATCASELASNAIRHGGGGRLECDASDDRLSIRMDDRGKGEPATLRARVEEARARVESDRGGSHGLDTLVRWMDAIEITHRPGGGLRITASRARTRRPRR
jgi:anti-sigma regulatory factor (Ser/Thr protein kinase)